MRIIVTVRCWRNSYKHKSSLIHRSGSQCQEKQICVWFKFQGLQTKVLIELPHAIDIWNFFETASY